MKCVFGTLLENLDKNNYYSEKLFAVIKKCYFSLYSIQLIMFWKEKAAANTGIREWFAYLSPHEEMEHCQSGEALWSLSEQPTSGSGVNNQMEWEQRAKLQGTNSEFKEERKTAGQSWKYFTCCHWVGFCETSGREQGDRWCCMCGIRLLGNFSMALKTSTEKYWKKSSPKLEL
jgi:hypothetical protein